MPKPNPFMAGVAPDPLPWLTQRFRDAGVFDAPDTLAKMDLFLGVVQSTVNSMSDNAASYVARFSTEHGSAFTDGKKKQVVVGAKVILDPTLTEGQVAAITLACAAHEVGHVRWSVTMTDRLVKHYGQAHRGQWALKVFNVLHDIHLEHWQAEDFPTLQSVFAFKGLYFARPWTLDLSRPQTRWGALVNATLYPHATDWTVSPEGVEFKAWADDWAKRARAKSARQTKTAIALVDEALAYLRYDEVIEPPPEDGHGGDGEPPEDDDEPEDEDDDGTGTAGDGDDDDFDEDDDDMRGGDPSGSGAPPESDPEGEKSEPEDGSGSGDGDDDSEDDESGDEPGSDAGSSGSKGSRESDDDGDEDGTTPAEDDDSPIERSIDEGSTTDGTEGQPLPSIHGDMHTSDDAGWQDAIDSYRSTQAAGRDKFVVGGGDMFKYREVRIIRSRV